jgi:hypothetical protein
VTGGRQKLQNEGLHNFHSSLNIIIRSMRMRWLGQAACIRDMENAYRTLIGKPEGKRPLGRPRYRWDNIKIDLKETAWGECGLDSSGSGYGSVAGLL